MSDRQLRKNLIAALEAEREKDVYSRSEFTDFTVNGVHFWLNARWLFMCAGTDNLSISNSRTIGGGRFARKVRKLLFDRYGPELVYAPEEALK